MTEKQTIGLKEHFDEKFNELSNKITANNAMLLERYDEMNERTMDFEFKPGKKKKFRDAVLETYQDTSIIRLAQRNPIKTIIFFVIIVVGIVSYIDFETVKEMFIKVFVR